MKSWNFIKDKAIDVKPKQNEQLIKVVVYSQEYKKGVKEFHSFLYKIDLTDNDKNIMMVKCLLECIEKSLKRKILAKWIQ